MSQATIRTAALSRRFGRTQALDQVDLAVPEGAIFALVGANGAGKTTLIKLLMNIMRPSSGEGEVLGIASQSLTGEAFTGIGYVSENQELPEGMKVGEFLGYMRGFYPAWDRGLEQDLVKQFDLPLDRRLKNLSRGMKMKAAFASSLAYRPRLIVLDEPFSGLDPLVRDELIEVLLERAPETTIFLSSHDLAEIESFSSHIGYLDRGRLLFSEEMTTLNARFRQATVTLAEPAALPAGLPKSWLEAGSVDCVVRFVDSGFVEQETEREIRERFTGVRAVNFDPMSLREIFLAIARTRREQAHERKLAVAGEETKG